MTRLVLVCVVAGTVAVAHETQAALVSTFKLVAICATSESAALTTRTGTGFLIHGPWTSSTDDVYLMTSLHVVYGCKTITVVRMDCGSGHAPASQDVLTFEPNTTVLTWPSFDLAAFPIPPTATSALGPNVVGLVPQRPFRVEMNEQLDIPGFSEGAICAQGLAWFGNWETVEERALSAKHGDPQFARRSVESLMGSLLPGAMIVSYFGSLSGGGSGAPVVSANGSILAVHTAGRGEGSLGWGIALPAIAKHLRNPKNSISATLGGHDWPTYREPLQAQAQSLAPTVDIEDVVRHRGPGILGFFLNGGVQAGRDFHDPRLTLAGGAWINLVRFPSSDAVWLNLRIGASCSIGGYVKQFSTPYDAGTVIESGGRATFFSCGVDSTLDASWRRFAFLPHLRAGGTWSASLFEVPTTVDSSGQKWGAARVVYVETGLDIGISVDVRVGHEWRPSTAYTYTASSSIVRELPADSGMVYAVLFGREW